MRCVEPIRLCHVIRPGVGGAAEYLLQLVRHTDRDRFDVTVICSPLEDPGYPDRVRELGVAVEVVPMVRPIRPLPDAIAFARVAEALDRGRFRVVHAHCAKSGFFARAAAWLVATPRVVYTPHGFAFAYGAMEARKAALYRRLERWAALRATDVLGCVSREEARLAMEVLGVPPAAVAVVPTAVDLSRYPAPEPGAHVRRDLGIPDGAVVVGMVGRLDPPKDPVAFVRLVAALGSGVYGLLVGDGGLMEEVGREADRLGISERLVCTGYRREIPSLLAVMTVLVLPTRGEGMPMAPLEGLLCGVPFVASDIPACRELAEKTGGGVVVASPEEMEAEVRRLLEDADLHAALAGEGRRQVEARFRPETWAAAWMDIYEG